MVAWMNAANYRKILKENLIQSVRKCTLLAGVKLKQRTKTTQDLLHAKVCKSPRIIVHIVWFFFYYYYKKLLVRSLQGWFSRLEKCKQKPETHTSAILWKANGYVFLMGFQLNLVKEFCMEALRRKNPLLLRASFFSLVNSRSWKKSKPRNKASEYVAKTIRKV